jgi:chromosome segregation ATPase
LVRSHLQSLRPQADPSNPRLEGRVRDLEERLRSLEDELQSLRKKTQEDHNWLHDWAKTNIQEIAQSNQLIQGAIAAITRKLSGKKL